MVTPLPPLRPDLACQAHIDMVLSLFFVDRMDTNQIAKELHWHESDIERLLHRGVERTQRPWKIAAPI